MLKDCTEKEFLKFMNSKENFRNTVDKSKEPYVLFFHDMKSDEIIASVIPEQILPSGNRYPVSNWKILYTQDKDSKDIIDDTHISQ